MESILSFLWLLGFVEHTIREQRFLGKRARLGTCLDAGPGKLHLGFELEAL